MLWLLANFPLSRSLTEVRTLSQVTAELNETKMSNLNLIDSSLTFVATPNLCLCIMGQAEYTLYV